MSSSIRAANPEFPGELVEISNLATWIFDAGDDLCVAHVRVVGDKAEQADFGLLEFTESRMEGCSYAGCDFERALFTDVVFSNCDFSNSTLSEANFTRCAFMSCKFIGADFSQAVLSRIEVRDSTFAYASLVKVQLADVRVSATDLSHADLAEVRQKRADFNDVRFVGTSFFRASLAGIDFSTCQLGDIVLSEGMGELRGCSMDMFQAASIARRLGVDIKE